MKIKTSDLTGIALDWAVAKAEGDTYDTKDWLTQGWLSLNGSSKSLPMYSTAWEFGGPIIEREGITPYEDPNWFEGRFATPRYLASKALRVVEGTYYSTQTGADPDQIGGDFTQSGDTYLIAAMRCYVSAKLGDEVELPEALA